MKNYFIYVICVLLLAFMFGCGQSKLERDAEYFHEHGMNYEQYQRFMESEKQQWMKDYLQSPAYFPREKAKKK